MYASSQRRHRQHHRHDYVQEQVMDEQDEGAQADEDEFMAVV
jgi:hypothetical protein